MRAEALAEMAKPDPTGGTSHEEARTGIEELEWESASPGERRASVVEGSGNPKLAAGASGTRGVPGRLDGVHRPTEGH